MPQKSSYFLIFLLLEEGYFIHPSSASNETTEQKPLLHILSEDLKDYPLLNPKIPEGKWELKNPKNIIGKCVHLPLYDPVFGKTVDLKRFRISGYIFESNKENNINCLKELLEHKSSTLTPLPYKISNEFRKFYRISNDYFIDDEHISRALRIVRPSNFARLEFNISKNDCTEYYAEGRYFSSDAYYKITLEEIRHSLNLGEHINKISKNEKFSNIYFVFQ